MRVWRIALVGLAAAVALIAVTSSSGVSAGYGANHAGCADAFGAVRRLGVE